MEPYPYLPLETWEAIASFLETPALLLLALTCSSMYKLAMTTARVWHTIELTEDMHWQYLHHSHHLPNRRVDRIWPYLFRRLSQECKLAVRVLILDGNVVEPDLLTSLLEYFPRVRSISLRSCEGLSLQRIHNIFLTLRETPEKYPTNLRELLLQGVDRRHPDDTLCDWDDESTLLAGLQEALTPAITLDISACSSCHSRIGQPNPKSCSFCRRSRSDKCAQCCTPFDCRVCDQVLCATCYNRRCPRLGSEAAWHYCDLCRTQLCLGCWGSQREHKGCPEKKPVSVKKTHRRLIRR